MPTPQEVNDNFNLIIASLKGERGPEQVELTVAGLELLALVLRKNADYGGSALKAPVMAPGTSPQAALRCRMSDKIQRVVKLSLDGPEVTTESIDDAIDDLAGYGMLDKVLRNRAEAIAAHKAAQEREAHVNDPGTTDKLETPADDSVPGSSDRADGECSDSEA